MRYTPPPPRANRGVQSEDVFAAADALIAEGKRPTIERVRLKIGRGSPNTVSPLLEHWFATLAPRLAAGPGTPVPSRSDSETGVAGSDVGALPQSVHSAARSLWEAACTEAQGRVVAQLTGDREQLEEREEALAKGQMVLAQREEVFTQTRASLDAALAASRRERDALAQQLKDRTAEERQIHARLESEVQRLAAQVAQLQDNEAQWRREQVQALAARDQERQRAEERQAGQERRWLTELDRTRLQLKGAEAELAKARSHQARLEETWAARAAGQAQQLEALRDTQQEAAAAARDELAAQSRDLAQARTELAIAQEREAAVRQRLDEEKSAHRTTRELVSLTMTSHAGGVNTSKPPRKRTSKRAPP